MLDRLIDMTFLNVGVTAFNIWDLPLWIWRAYAREVDRLRVESAKSKPGV